MSEQTWTPVDPVAASFTLQVWAHQRNCVVCGEPGANAHHILFASQGGEKVLANGAMLCGSGTMGCHGLMTAMDEETRRAIGEYILDQRPDTVSYLTLKLGGRGAQDFLRRVYLTEVEMSAPQPGHVDAAQVVIFEDAAGEHRWRALDTNNATVADSGEGYKSRDYAEKAATDLFPDAVVRYEGDED